MTLQQIREGAILLFNKPFDWSSFDVVNKVRRLTNVKAGHAGTLDPYATGLLIICTGKFTKRIREFQDTEKEYTGTMVLGGTTPSYDLETEVDSHFDISQITDQQIHDAVHCFTGEIMQAPPVYSAIFVDGGKRAYKKARKGHVFEMEKRKVMLHAFEITKIELPCVEFRVVCGKGFYVRSLVHDFGKLLNAGAHLSQLCRTRIGQYRLDEAWQVSDFAKFVESEKQKLHQV